MLLLAGLGNPGEGSPVGNIDIAAVATDEPLHLHCTQRAIDVNRGYAGGVRNVHLRHWQGDRTAIRTPARMAAHHQFTQEIGYPRPCFPPPNVGYPGPVNRNISGYFTADSP